MTLNSDAFWINHESKGRENYRESGVEHCHSKILKSLACLHDEAIGSSPHLITNQWDALSRLKDCRVDFVRIGNAFDPRTCTVYISSSTKSVRAHVSAWFSDDHVPGSNRDGPW